MNFHQRRKNPTVSINYNNYKIEEINQAKFLGIMVDNKLMWKPHIEEVCMRLNKSAYALFQLSKKVNMQTLLTGTGAWLLQFFDLIFWGQSTDRELIFKMQKRRIHSMCGL